MALSQIKPEPLALWRYKACPRCSGDLRLSEDLSRTSHYAKSYVCIQCGYRKEVENGRTSANTDRGSGKANEAQASDDSASV
jgi:C4-type Zn-finger protein